MAITIPKTLAKLKAAILREPARFTAVRVLPGGKTTPLAPFGRYRFGNVALLWLKRRAVRLRWKIIVKRIPPSAGQIEATRRAKLIAAARWALTIEARFHYAQIRPFNVNAIRDRKSSITTDCSGSTVMLYKAAGFPDPTGNGYDGGRSRPTYTGTLRSASPRKSLASAKAGDFIVHGRGNGVHVTVIVVPHPTNPLVFSHGQESGPRLYRLSVQLATHGSYFTVHGPRKG